MTRKMSMEILAAEEAAERARPTVEDSFRLITEKEHAGTRYSLLSDDLLIRGGRFSDRRVSELVRTVEGRDFVGQLWKLANAEMRNVIRLYFSE